MEGQAPAEPDDPNSSTLNPNKHEKLGVGKGNELSHLPQKMNPALWLLRAIRLFRTFGPGNLGNSTHLTPTPLSPLPLDKVLMNFFRPWFYYPRK